MASSLPSRSNHTIIRAMLNRFRVRPPAWAAFCATFSPWVRGPLPCSIHCVLARSPRASTPRKKKRGKTAASSMASSAASEATEIVSASPRSEAKSPLSLAIHKTRSSTPSLSASRGGTGIEIDLAKVPQRETGMTPYEIMLSESQERMLLVAEKGREHEVLAVFKKWGLDAVVVGQVNEGGMARIKNNGRVAAEIHAHPLAEEEPVYHRPSRAPAPRAESG